MGIPIAKSFVVKAPAGAVWDFLTDPYRVASCLPGAAITGKEEDDQTWGGTMTVKVGPVTASYRGKLRFVELDPVGRKADISASGQETRGKGGADMRMRSRIVELSPGETEVMVASDVNVVGVLAQFGRGMIQDVSDQLFGRFTEAMRRQLEAAPAGVAAAGEGGAAGTGTAAAAGAAGGAAGASGGAAVPEAPAPSGAAASEATLSEAAPSGATPAGATPAEAGPAGAAAPPSPAAGEENFLDVGSLGTAALGRAAGRTVRRPGFWIAVAILALIVYWLATR